jgi:RNA polymerase sigma-70 factor (ECF subfamily)
MSDLGRRFASGDESAFDQVVDEYARKVHALCYRVLRDEEEAKDMAQEVFLRIYRKRKSFKGRSSLYTWIYRVALNMCFSHMKKRKSGMVPLEAVEHTLASRPAEDDSPERIDLEESVKKAMESLPPKQRAVFALRFFDKMSFKEVAGTMGTSVGAAKANYHFAVERLRVIIGEEKK